MNERLLTKIALERMEVTPDENGVINVGGEKYRVSAPAPASKKESQPVAVYTKDKPKPSNSGDFDINSFMPWLLAGGLGLIGHSVGSAMAGEPSPEQRRKETVWERVLRSLIPIGMGGLAGYGGYRLGEYLKTASDKAAQAAAAGPGPQTVFRTPAGPVSVDKSNADDFQKSYDYVKDKSGKSVEEILAEGNKGRVGEAGKVPSWLDHGDAAIWGAGGTGAGWLGSQVLSELKGLDVRKQNAKAKRQMLMNKAEARKNLAEAKANYQRAVDARNRNIALRKQDHKLADSAMYNAQASYNEAQGQPNISKAQKNLDAARTRERNAYESLVGAEGTELPSEPKMGRVPRPEGYRAPARGRDAWIHGRYSGPKGRWLGRIGAFATPLLALYGLGSKLYGRHKANNAAELKDRLDKVRINSLERLADTNAVPPSAQSPR